VTTGWIALAPGDTILPNHTVVAGDILYSGDPNLALAQSIGTIFWPLADPVVAAAQAMVVPRRAGDHSKAARALLSAALYSLAGGAGGQLEGFAASGAGQLAGVIAKATVTITAAMCTAAATTQAFNLSPLVGGPALPTNARIIAREIRLTGTFTGTTTATLSLGTSATPGLIVNAQDVRTSAGAFAGPAGSDPGALVSGATLQASITTSGGNVSALAGSGASVTVDTLWTLLP
jgi:hypothetical protein